MGLGGKNPTKHLCINQDDHTSYQAVESMSFLLVAPGTMILNNVVFQARYCGSKGDPSVPEVH